MGKLLQSSSDSAPTPTHSHPLKIFFHSSSPTATNQKQCPTPTCPPKKCHMHPHFWLTYSKLCIYCLITWSREVMRQSRNVLSAFWIKLSPPTFVGWLMRVRASHLLYYMIIWWCGHVKSCDKLETSTFQQSLMMA